MVTGKHTLVCQKFVNAHYLRRQRTTFSIARQTKTFKNLKKINILVPENRRTSVAC